MVYVPFFFHQKRVAFFFSWWGQSGAIKVLCEILAEGSNVVEEQTAGVCASIVRDPAGRNIMFEEGAVTALAELVEAGETARTKEYAVNALLGLAAHSKACLAAIDDEGIDGLHRCHDAHGVHPRRRPR